MDPESVAFQPRDDFWRFQDEMLRVQQSQAELSDRLARLERKQDDDSRLKNVWGTSSPFPSVLGGTPQQGMSGALEHVASADIMPVPLQQPTAENFLNFDDDQSSNLIGNLQLDADDEPRRVGTTSRANSVRFDETANHGHWAHASRTSLDLLPRSGSSLGGHALSERSYSHKSDGRQSSAGQSVHSVTSGRANSLTSYGLTTPVDVPGLAPGLFILGSVPSIIRCWLNTNFKHDTLLYAAICTGSHTSYLDLQLIDHLGFQDQITQTEDGGRKIKLTVYLPEAVPISASVHSDSPDPQLPSLTIDFTVVDEYDMSTPKAVQIMIGSDLLRAHNADVLFSTNQLMIYDDERSKLQVPLVRPEDESAFRTLSTSHAIRYAIKPGSATTDAAVGPPTAVEPKVKFLDTTQSDNRAAQKGQEIGTAGSSDDGETSGRRSLDQRPVTSSARSDSKDAHSSSAATATARSGPPPPTMLSSWRRDTNEKANSHSLDWANVGKTTASPSGQPRREIKVLRPSRSASRTFSSSTSASGSGQSRFFDDGKRKGDGEASTGTAAPSLSRTVSGEKDEGRPGGTKSRSVNPVGGASAFAWLKNGSK
jgi:ubiquitin carboxyl-terminal hydrolase 4/11/15